MISKKRKRSVNSIISSAIKSRAKELHLGDIDEVTLPDRLEELSSVRLLKITGSRNLCSLPDSLYLMRNLEFLDIKNCPIVDLPKPKGNVPSLKGIRFRELSLASIPSEISNLKNVEEIFIQQCPLTSLPSSIGDIENLKRLSLIGLRLTKIPSEIGGLRSLEYLNAKSNNLSNLPDSIEELQSLRQLILTGNNLSSLPESIGNLNNLIEIDVAHNRLSNLPSSLHKISSLKSFKVSGNAALAIPVELQDEPKQIFDFFLRGGKRRMLKEAKVLLIGQGGVGKTSLVNRLIDSAFSETEPKTEGINVRGWSSDANDKSVKLNVWDFGGQEIMHATHQFFLTKRSLYILVLDARAGERESNIHYWLEMIRVYGANSPLIIVLNKTEQHHEELDVNRLKLDYKGLVNFVGFHSVSCLTGAGIAELSLDIDTAVHGLKHVWDYLPADYFEIKETLECLSDNTDFITADEYRNTCESSRVYDLDEQKRLLRFLHDVGCVLHYDDPEQRYHVHDTRVLNPSWVTSGVYKVLNDPEFIRDGTGVVKNTDLSRVLDPLRYPIHRYPFLIEIMKKYELCIEIPDIPSSVLVPELLSKNEPDVGWVDPTNKESLRFEYHYAVLPRGLIPRFIVRTRHLLSKKRTVWRAGAVLDAEHCRVLVRGDIRKAKVFIQVQGEQRFRRGALAVVRSIFGSVHRSYGDITAEAKVPLPLDPAAPPVDYNFLIKLERQGVTDTLFEKADKSYNIRELLDGIDERKYELFISHNSENKQLVRELYQSLTKIGVRCWFDEEHLTPGESWQTEIAYALEKCTAILVVLGAVGDGPWQREEVQIALNYAVKNRKKVIPVLIAGSKDINELTPEYSFLKSRTAVDLRSGFSEKDLHRIAQAVAKVN